jgi:hypothetical protein
MNHRTTTMRVALHARLYAGLAANTAGRVDEELEAVHNAAFSTRQAATLYSGIFDIGSSARFVSRFADLFSGQW